MLDRSRFYKDVREIFPEGDLGRSFDMLSDIIMGEMTTVDGHICDYDYIMNKFRQYHDSWNIKYAKKLERGFLDKKSEESRVTIYQFLAQDMFKRDFAIETSNPERDKYLFGDSYEKLHKKITEIEDEIYGL